MTDQHGMLLCSRHGAHALSSVTQQSRKLLLSIFLLLALESCYQRQRDPEYQSKSKC